MEKANILIVSKESVDALEIEECLGRLGYKVSSFAGNGEGLINKVEKEKPDIILVDIGIKEEIDQIEAANTIRLRFGLPVIFSTPYMDEERLQRAQITKPFQYVLRPIRERELNVTIEMALFVAKEDRERQQTQQALEESEKKYKYILEDIQDGYFEIDLNGNFTLINDSMCRICKGKRDEILDSNFRDYLDEENTGKVLNISKHVCKNKKSGEIFDLKMINKEGVKRFIELSMSMMKDTKGNLSGFYGIIRDITKKKTTEQALRNSEEHYRTLFERSSDAIFIVDRKTGRYLNANQAAERLTGFSMADIRTMKTTDLTPVGARQRLDIVSVLESRKEFDEIKYNRADGTTRDTILTAIPIGGNQIMGIAHDITDIKRAEEILKRAHLELESEVKMRTLELEEINNALTVLLKRSDKDRAELEEKVLSNVKELIIPIVKKLGKSQLDINQLNLLGAVEANLNNIISPFSRILSSKFSHLTPREIQIAILIKEGKTSKEIAESIASNKNAIEFHRKNIRKKLGLRNNKKNLRTHLLSLQ